MNFTDLEQYINQGIELLVKEALQRTLKNPRETSFLLQYGMSLKKAAAKRGALAAQGEHIPPFLIASVTKQCNLHCAGCYDRARSASVEGEMSRESWRRIFAEAEELGVTAILLAGGEPLLRSDVLEEAARRSSLLFPVFTNGVLLNRDYVKMFDRCRHLIPIISIEGGEKATDARRGAGVYAKTAEAMGFLKERDLLFGASITVTKENLLEVTGEEAVSDLEERGCRVIVFVEYVPVDNPAIALDEEGRKTLAANIEALRRRRNMMIISFPGDEKESGGCLAAGRGFFHINAAGGAEPCPFSPYYNDSLKETSLRDVLRSPLFTRLREEGALTAEHQGGCALFDQAKYVAALAAETKAPR